MTQKKSWGSEVEFIYTRGPRGGSLQILGAWVRQKPVHRGRGLIATIGVKMWGGDGAKREAGAYRRQWLNAVAYGLAELS